MVECLLFSDLHLDAAFAWADVALARKRRQALRDTLVRIVDLALATHPAAVLCGGDLYEHDRVSADTAEFIRAQFGRLDPIPVYVAPGNHDWYGPPSLYRRLDWSRNVRIFSSDRLEPVPLGEGVVLWGVAHCAPAGARGFLDHFRVDRPGLHLALFHGSERSALPFEGGEKVPHAPFDAAQIEAAGLQHAFLGHYHQPRDAARYTYPGNPDPLTFGEEGERGIVIATCQPDGTVLRRRQRVAVTEVSDLTVDVSGCNSRHEILERVANALAPASGVVRLTVVGEVGTAVDLAEADLLHVHEARAAVLDGLVVRNRIRAGYDLAAIGQERTVRGQFVRDVQTADLSDEDRTRVLTTGLRALDGREDLEVT